MPSLLKIFRPVTQNTLIFLFGLIQINSFLASSDFCGLLITFASSLEPDQERQNVGPDMDQNCSTLSDSVLEEFF